jgi:hypothetical protein
LQHRYGRQPLSDSCWRNHRLSLPAPNSSGNVPSAKITSTRLQEASPRLETNSLT